MLSKLRENLNFVRDRMADACRRAGRAIDAVQLIAVTKSAPPGAIAGLVDLGQTRFGENRPQQLVSRQTEWPAGEWHLIGHLQRNKAKSVLDATALIHSVDSLRLAERISELAVPAHRVPILFEVNVSGEDSKDGFDPTSLWQAWEQLLALPGIEIRGLMTMAPIIEDLGAARTVFTGLRELRDALQSRSPETVSLAELSMGMSGDYEAAVLEGATLVRVGSRLFQGLT